MKFYIPWNNFSWFGGAVAGESSAGILVNSSLKLLVSNSPESNGLNGAGTALRARALQSKDWKSKINVIIVYY